MPSGPLADAAGRRAALTAEQITFLGGGWTYGLAQEAALKMREAAGAWTEAYPAMEYRHGPIAITGRGRVAWMFGTLPDGLAGGRRGHRRRPWSSSPGWTRWPTWSGPSGWRSPWPRRRGTTPTARAT